MPLRSSPQCYRSCVGMLTIICVDTYASVGGQEALSTDARLPCRAPLG